MSINWHQNFAGEIICFFNANVCISNYLFESYSLFLSMSIYLYIFFIFFYNLSISSKYKETSPHFGQTAVFTFPSILLLNTLFPSTNCKTPMAVKLLICRLYPSFISVPHLIQVRIYFPPYNCSIFSWIFFVAKRYIYKNGPAYPFSRYTASPIFLP